VDHDRHPGKEEEEMKGAPVNDRTGPDFSNLEFVEQLYAQFNRDPDSVSAEWGHFFGKAGNGTERETTPRFGPAFEAASIFHSPLREETARAAPADSRLRDRVNQMVTNYRARGHLIARIDPLETPRECPDELQLAHYAFSQADLDSAILTEEFASGAAVSIREIHRRLLDAYGGSVGVQFIHINNLALREWLQERLEHSTDQAALSAEEQRRILARLTAAEMFEQFIRKKFIGAKSFSLEGSESLVALLDLALEKAGEQDIQEIVIGMAHRGRLNVLANIVGKKPRQIFREFADIAPENHAAHGDVKYHLGHSGEWKTAAGKSIHLSLCFNPSHLEFVNPVVLGRVRAKQDRAGEAGRARGMALLIHGDAAMAGEGILQETLNMASLPGYSVGGTLHIVVNNQIGYTTSPAEARSATYATDVALMLESPVFHVNGEDLEAVARVVRIALDFRREFQRDVFIDLIGYRQFGHNESDEPTFTQPTLYHAIEKRVGVRESFLQRTLKSGSVTREDADEIAAHQRDFLEKEFSQINSGPDGDSVQTKSALWQNYTGGLEQNAVEVDTGVAKERLAQLLETHLPDGFHAHPKIQKGLEIRRAMAAGDRPLDWAAAETLAFGSLAVEAYRIRLSGQDCGRGTFSQRHAILYDFEDGHPYIPLQHLAADQAPVEIFNSPLSEAGVLGFDYGYSLDCPDGLVLWEAQFGDFVNAAQVIVDQFLTSAEEKWNRLSGLVLLLPHGLEGMGPEHSCARLERFLALAARDNIQIIYPTTPAQYFHCLRRQVLRRWRKPLVVMTPKSLLRHPAAVSSLEDCAAGNFRRVLPETRAINSPDRILLCTGKIYYELAAFDSQENKTPIIRLEQLYPFPERELAEALKDFPDGTPAHWVQEEPENMGAWRFLRDRVGEFVFGRFPFYVVSRPESASPATGSARGHKLEQQKIIEQSFHENPQKGKL
jgi:2-oxoglutarate dehydrogenase E1 component